MLLDLNDDDLLFLLRGQEQLRDASRISQHIETNGFAVAIAEHVEYQTTALIERLARARADEQDRAEQRTYLGPDLEDVLIRALGTDPFHRLGELAQAYNHAY